jgi:tRNA-specific 2-thiouridylase
VILTFFVDTICSGGTEAELAAGLLTMAEKSAKVVALLSGGLDSSLAVLLMRRQKVDVHAIMFMTHFGCSPTDKSSCSYDPFPLAEKYGFVVKMAHLGQQFVQIVKNPKFGHGKNMNPCVDCRILMLSEARHVMERLGADAIITGEVLGQRPMSQTRDKLNLVAKETGLKGRLLRPLCAKLMEPTIPEQEGKIDRSQLESISGRSRHRQMQLADEFGMDDYPNPASGCLLTDPNYSRRLKDLLTHDPGADFTALNLLKVGRHFRFSPKSKIVVGRMESENDLIEKYRRPQDIQFEAKDTGSPITLLVGDAEPNAIEFAARLTARYCDHKTRPSVRITVSFADREEVIEVPPAEDAVLQELRL